MSQRLTKFWVAAISAWRPLLPKHPPRYRPEAHYMRGPGPKWRAKHAAISGQQYSHHIGAFIQSMKRPLSNSFRTAHHAQSI